MANRFPKSRRGAQTEAAQSAEFFRQLAETIPQMLWTARPDGSIDYFNPRVYEYTGRTQRQLVDWGWRAMVHPDDWERCLARWNKAFKKSQPYEVEYRLRRRDGRYFWHLGAAMPLREGGRIVRWVGTCTEIENQKRAERLLEKARGALQSLVAARDVDAPHDERASRKREERLRSMMTISSDFFWETDAEHRFTSLETGGRFATLMVTSKRLGKTRWETPSVLPDAAGWQAHRDTLEARRAFRDFETTRVGDDGVVHYYSIDGEPVFGESGEFRGYEGVGREITARKLAELALRENDRQFRAFLDSMPAVAWIKDSRFRYTWVSASYQRVFGKSLRQVQGRENFDVWPTELARQYRRDDEDALRANGPVQSISDVPCADGSTARLVVVKFPLPDGAGALGVAGIGFDITARGGDVPAPPGADAGNPLERLSARERQVLQMIVDGRTSAEVAENLGLSPKSVDTYRSRMMAKLDIGDLPTLVKFAIRHRITTAR
jgi:PAS domain S-box-containing protein